MARGAGARIVAGGRRGARRAVGAGADGDDLAAKEPGACNAASPRAHAEDGVPRSFTAACGVPELSEHSSRDTATRTEADTEATAAAATDSESPADERSDDSDATADKRSDESAVRRDSTANNTTAAGSIPADVNTYAVDADAIHASAADGERLERRRRSAADG